MLLKILRFYPFLFFTNIQLSMTNPRWIFSCGCYGKILLPNLLSNSSPFYIRVLALDLVVGAAQVKVAYASRGMASSNLSAFCFFLKNNFGNITKLWLKKKQLYPPVNSPWNSYQLIDVIVIYMPIIYSEWVRRHFYIIA